MKKINKCSYSSDDKMNTSSNDFPMDDKQIKEFMRKEASKNPEKFYPINVLKTEGFYRKRCKICGRWFWTTDPDREVCGDSQCIGGFNFISNTPAKKEMSYVELWKEFRHFFERRGYEAIKRYPVVARWNPSVEFTIASIVDFQPYVVNGSIKPPANPLVVPQPCLRFNDIDNVGLTGSHFTNFVMIGQHAFMPPEKYDQEKYFQDIHDWLVHGMKIPKDEIIFHEDAWAGGGNGGASLEFFSRGLELGNQVYTMYDFTKGKIEQLKLKVLDMGAGQERMAWFSQGKATAYDTTFPKTINYITSSTGIKIDQEFRKKFLHYAPLLNVDEVDDINKAWQRVANAMNLNVDELKQKALDSQKIYSIAEHTRSLLFAISDGLLPSNVGGGYNLRVIFRRAYRFYSTLPEFDFMKLFELHTNELKPQYPELKENINEVQDIIDEEIKKYRETKKKHLEIIAKLDKVDVEKLITLYDSYGITPDEIKNEANLNIEIPPNFYKLVAERHSIKQNITATKKKLPFDLPELETEILYYGDWRLTSFSAKVLFVKHVDGKTYIVPDKSAFYPTSGGQMHDKGWIIIKDENENAYKYEIVDGIKYNKAIVLVINGNLSIDVGDEFECEIDFETRRQLTQHHTATHLLNGVVRELYGNHIWQHSASKTFEKAKLDLTHHKMFSLDEIKKIEKSVLNYIKQDLKVEKFLMERDEAEKQFGFRIYQGGAVPGKVLRIVKILKKNNHILDVEACGGTHLNSLSELEDFKIIDVKKPQDGIVRFEFVAGNAAKKLKINALKLAVELIELLKDFVDIKDLTIEELKAQLELDKDLINENKLWTNNIDPETLLTLGEVYDELKIAAKELSCSVEQLKSTLNRFIKEMNEIKREYGIDDKEKSEDLLDGILKCFELWKIYKKRAEILAKEIVEEIGLIVKDAISKSGESNFILLYVDKDVKLLAKALEQFQKFFESKNVLLYNSKGMFSYFGSDEIFNRLRKEGILKGGGKQIKQGKIDLARVDEIKEILKLA